VFLHQALQVGHVIATLSKGAGPYAEVQSAYLVLNPALVGTTSIVQVIQTEEVDERRIDAAEAAVTPVATEGNPAVAEVPLRHQSQVVNAQKSLTMAELKNRAIKIQGEDIRPI
jgi:hypothetical protein